MLALWKLQATILFNPHVNQFMWQVTQGGDPRFPLDSIDPPLNLMAVPSAPSLGPPAVPFHSHPSRLPSPHVSGIASDDVTSLDRTQTLGTTPDQPAGVQNLKQRCSFGVTVKDALLILNQPQSGHEEERIAGPR